MNMQVFLWCLGLCGAYAEPMRNSCGDNIPPARRPPPTARRPPADRPDMSEFRLFIEFLYVLGSKLGF